MNTFQEETHQREWGQAPWRLKASRKAQLLLLEIRCQFLLAQPWDILARDSCVSLPFSTLFLSLSIFFIVAVAIKSSPQVPDNWSVSGMNLLALKMVGRKALRLGRMASWEAVPPSIPHTCLSYTLARNPGRQRWFFTHTPLFQVGFVRHPWASSGL